MHKLDFEILFFFAMLALMSFLLCVSCNHSIKKTEVEGCVVMEIDIIENLHKNQKISLSAVASNIEYCLLETDKKCLVANKNMYCTREHVVTIGDQCYVFDRNTGSFVRQISSKGQGPDEYTDYINFWDNKNEQICLLGNNQFYFFNLDGTLSHKANRFKHSLHSFVQHNDFYVRYVTNSLGNSKSRIEFYNKSGILVDSIPNYRSWERTKSSYGSSTDSWLYIFHDNLYYKDLYCDTLYHINNFMLQPRYIFNTGGQAVPYEIQEGGAYEVSASLSSGVLVVDRYEKYMRISEMFEDNNNLYFTIRYKKYLYPAIYVKKENNLQIMPPISMPPITRYSKIPLYGFENDLDGGLPFWPTQMISEKEMMCVYTAEELLELDSSKITDEKLKNVLNNLEEDSNPVVVIVTLKD